MEEKSETRPTTAVLTDGEARTLINLAGIAPSVASPLAQVGPAAAPAPARLRQAGLLDAAGRLTPAATECVALLANPALEIELLWGSADRVSLSRVYGADGDRLVAYTKAPDGHHLSFFLASTDITDLVTAQAAFPEIKEAAGLSLEAEAGVLPVFFAALDLAREEQLRAALERRVEGAALVTREAVTRLLAAARVEPNYAWYAPAACAALPDVPPVTDGSLAAGLLALQRAGLLDANGRLEGACAVLAGRAFPLLSFCAVKVLKSGAATEKSELALLRGLGSLLFVQLEEGGRASLSSISTSRLPEVLADLAVHPFEAPSAVPAEACPKCGATRAPGAKFCPRCGASARDPFKARFCPKCGDSVALDEKFCNRCGNKLG